MNENQIDIDIDTTDEQTKYIIMTSEDYADEFNYPIISVFTAKERNIILLHNNLLSNDDFDEIYFGTNEFFSFLKNEIIRYVREAKQITDEELEVLEKFRVLDLPGIDIVDHTIDRMAYKSESIKQLLKNT